MVAEQHLDFDALDELKDVMGDEFSLLIDTFIDDSTIRIETIKVAIKSGEAEAIRRTAHSFKGSAGNMGAVRLTGFCRSLEDLGSEGQTEGAEAIFDDLVKEYKQVKQSLNQL